MKKHILLVVFLMAFKLNAQLIIDDFTTGSIDKLTFVDRNEDPQLQKGNNIIGNFRSVYAKITQNPYGQNMQLSIGNGLMVMSYAYDTRGTTFVNYGVNKSGNAPLNLELSKYKFLKVAFEAKSTVNGIYVALFTGNTRATYSKHVQAREGKFTISIPFSEIKPVGDKFTFKDVDFIRLQFDSRSKTGCNMAIKKIWFE